MSEWLNSDFSLSRTYNREQKKANHDFEEPREHGPDFEDTESESKEDESTSDPDSASSGEKMILLTWPHTTRNQTPDPPNDPTCTLEHPEKEAKAEQIYKPLTKSPQLLKMITEQKIIKHQPQQDQKINTNCQPTHTLKGK